MVARKINWPLRYAKPSIMIEANAAIICPVTKSAMKGGAA